MENDDRFGIREDLILQAIERHAGIIRAGCYVPTRSEVTTKDPAWVHSVLLDWFWESPTELIPTADQVREVVAILRARADADHPLIQAVLAELP